MSAQITAAKLKNMDIKTLCEKATNVADKIDIMLGGIDWLVNSKEAKSIISFFDPEIKDNLLLLQASSRAPLRISEKIIVTIDKYLIGPKCKRMHRASRKEKGVELMSSLFEDITNVEAYENVCYIAGRTVKLLSKLMSILSTTVSNPILVASITSMTGPETIVGLRMVHSNGKELLKVTKTVNDTVCVYLKKAVTNKS